MPTFDVSDVVDAGPSVGLGAVMQFAPKRWLMGDVDLGFHSGADPAGGGEAPDVKVYHYIAKLGYELLSEGQSPWSVGGHISQRLAVQSAIYVGFTGDSPIAGTAPADHANHKGFDEGWLGLVGLAGRLGLKRRDRDDAKPGEVNRSDVSRGAASRV